MDRVEDAEEGAERRLVGQGRLKEIQRTLEDRIEPELISGLLGGRGGVDPFLDEHTLAQDAQIIRRRRLENPLDQVEVEQEASVAGGSSRPGSGAVDAGAAR